MSSKIGAFALNVVGYYLMASGATYAQDYPIKTVRIVTSTAGGGVDFAVRLIAPDLSARLGQPVIVDNRGNTVSGEIAAKAPPDGYTLLASASVLWLSQFLRDHVSWDAVRDFAPISITNRQPLILVVHPSLPVKSVKELISVARAKPGALNYASAGTGAATHLAAELFKHMGRVDIVHIPYKGAGPATTSLVGGHVQLMFASSISVVPHVKSGRLRAVAVTSAEPTALMPGVPTVAASGLPEYEFASMYGMFAPAKTPTAIINRLSQQIALALNKTDIKEKFFATGVEVVGSTPDQLSIAMKAEMTSLGKVIKDAGIRAD